jgi:hypothetical protein
MKKSYRELLKECGYTDEMMKGMSEEDCEAEYIELCFGGHGE